MTSKNSSGKGENHPAWKGGKYLDQKGYVCTYMPDHHRSNTKGYVFEHVVVMEKKLGRMILRKDGEIHHRDGNKSNNDPSNLLLLTPREHRLVHAKSLGKVYSSGKEKEEKLNVVPKDKLPKGCYYLRIT